MDIYTRFNLPPPPPPTIFSRDDSVNRARLPNFTSVEEVSTFINNTIVWRHSTPLDRFFFFTMVFKLVLELSLFGFILHKIAKRSWWVIRVARRGHSIRLVPNVHSCWALLMGSFGLLTVGYFGITHYFNITSRPVQNVALWMVLMWTPMCFAIWYQTWAMFATWQNDAELAIFSLPAWLPPLLVDFFYICLPGIPSIAAMIPAVLANQHGEQARLDWYAWQTNFAGQVDLSRDMVLDAQTIFTSTLHGAYYLSIAFVIWFIACIGFVAAYAIASVGLISDLRQIVSKPMDRPVRPPRRGIEQLGTSDFKSIILQHNFHRDTGSHSSAGNTHSTPTSDLSYESDKIEGQLFSVVEVEGDRSETFFPPVAPSLTVQELNKSQARNVLFWYALQSISVVLGGMTLAADILYVLISAYPAAEQNRLETVQARAYLVVSVIMILFGLSSAVSITHATFEASFAALMTARRNVGRTSSRP